MNSAPANLEPVEFMRFTQAEEAAAAICGWVRCSQWYPLHATEWFAWFRRS